MIHLSQRLQAIADFVPQGAAVADIGTDHGFLPCYLAQQQRADKLIACDVNAQPLALAQKNIEDYNLQEQVQTRLGDGLTVLQPDEVTVVTIAGMGGENIAAILRAAPWACRNTLCILQPMSRPEELRAALPSLGLTIRADRLVRDARRLYPVLAVRAGAPEALSAGELYCGKYSLLSNDTLFSDILAEQDKRLDIAVRGLECSGRESDRERLNALRLAAADIAKMRRKYHGDGS